ncbi:hypothetical protein PGT21_015275 [Puccinia graminis f. sp. tritici]|uniref:Uncharacterized protein n=1 Tax=Puccinia graminis f. sp. tritici TaxID=56615 RepID=A0A5B0QAW2_PUCGR|nr:hypothetical protein PGT21_015275 [Puccinia graminis f. sp. tritici]
MLSAAFLWKCQKTIDPPRAQLRVSSLVPLQIQNLYAAPSALSDVKSYRTYLTSGARRGHEHSPQLVSNCIQTKPNYT